MVSLSSVAADWTLSTDIGFISTTNHQKQRNPIEEYIWNVVRHQEENVSALQSQLLLPSLRTNEPQKRDRLKLISGQLRPQTEPSSRSCDETKTDAQVSVSTAIAALMPTAASTPGFHLVIAANRISIPARPNKKLLRWAAGGQTAGSIPGQPLRAEPEAATSSSH